MKDKRSRDAIRRAMQTKPDQRMLHKHWFEKFSIKSAFNGFKDKSRVAAPGYRLSGFGSPWDPATAAWIDLETTGLGSFISTEGVKPGSAMYDDIIKKYGFEIAHQGLTKPPSIWEIGLKLSSDKGHPDSIFMKPDKITKMEVGAEEAARKAKTWKDFQRVINSADTPSEKAGIETALKKIKEAKR